MHGDKDDTDKGVLLHTVTRYFEFRTKTNMPVLPAVNAESMGAYVISANVSHVMEVSVEGLGGEGVANRI